VEENQSPEPEREFEAGRQEGSPNVASTRQEVTVNYVAEDKLESGVHVDENHGPESMTPYAYMVYTAVVRCYVP
jgi:hypothetical protein